MYYFISAELSTLSERENIERTEELRDTLTISNIPFQEVEGRYSGQPETSFMITSEYEARAIARIWDQECYLALDSRGAGTLHKPDGEYLATLGLKRLRKEAPMGDHTKIGEVYLTFI